MNLKSIRSIVAGCCIAFLPIGAVSAADMPTFSGFCTKIAAKELTLINGMLAYAQCDAYENRAKSELEKHWSLVTDSDLKECFRYNGTMYEIDAYSMLEGCLADLIGNRCLSGKLDCSGKAKP